MNACTHYKGRTSRIYIYIYILKADGARKKDLFPVMNDIIILEQISEK